MIPPILFAYRTAVFGHAVNSPFCLKYGRTPRLPIDMVYPTAQEVRTGPHEATIMQRLAVKHKALRKFDEVSTQKNKRLYDERHLAVEFKEGAK